MWFVNRNDEGIIYNKYFSPLPTEVIALVLAVVGVFLAIVLIMLMMPNTRLSAVLTSGQQV